MSLVALLSAKSAPGVTTAVQALGRFWPVGRSSLIVECDPAGGDLARRLGLDEVAGLSSFAASLREAVTAAALQAHATRLAGGELALTGPTNAVEATSALAVGGPALARAAADTDALDVIADCGRLFPGSAAEVLVDAANAVVVVVRVDKHHPHDSAAALTHARDAIGRLPKHAPVVAAVVGSGPYADADIQDALGVPVVGRLPLDRRGVAQLLAAPATGWEASLLARTSLARAATRMAAAVVSLVAGGALERAVDQPPLLSVERR